ncbi:MAG: peptidylprolyl isomerase [Myxococcota bacterium]
MAEDSTIADGKVVAIAFVLKNPSGTELDRSDEDKPLHYLHGKNNIVPGLEKALTGKTVGDAIDVVVSPEEGYGKPFKEKPIQVRRSELPTDAKLERGMQFFMQNERGQTIPVWVKKIQGPSVVVTRNHPLAGQELHFHAEVRSVRDATEEELSQGHVHNTEATTDDEGAEAPADGD